MKLLDLYSCEGGAGVGYSRAGFDVFGVDIVPQPRYPFPFLQASALDVLDQLLAGFRLTFYGPDGSGAVLGLDDFEAIHASPPCQAYSNTRHTHDVVHPELVVPTRERLIRTGLPYIIENVVGAPLIDPLMLCGSEFGLSAVDVDGTRLRMERHRLFESNVFLVGNGGCVHNTRVQVAGAYGGGSSDRRHAKTVLRGGYTPSKAVREKLLGIDWMTLNGLSQSIPPAYTAFLGDQLADALVLA